MDGRGVVGGVSVVGVWCSATQQQQLLAAAVALSKGGTFDFST